MSLKDLVLPSEKVDLPGGASFDVYGVNLEAIILALPGRSDQFEALFQHFAKSEGDVTEMEMGAIGIELFQVFPDIAAVIIAAATGDSGPEAVAVAGKLPISVQLSALQKIARLTFDTEGSLKNSVEIVIQAFRLVRNLMVSDLEALPSGSQG